MNLIVRWILNTVALVFVASFVEGFVISGWWAAIAAAAVLGLVNLLVRPIILLLTLPINIVTLGLFTFVVNAGMLLLVQSIVKGVTITGWGPALIGAILLWLINWVANSIGRPQPTPKKI
jgi:putative membrane protein